MTDGMMRRVVLFPALRRYDRVTLRDAAAVDDRVRDRVERVIGRRHQRRARR